MQFRALTLTLALTTAGLITACGGGSGDTATGVQPPTPPVTTSVTLTGVVARGAALAGAAVSAKCAANTGTATSGTGGDYTLTVTAGVFPCVVQATSSDAATVLHSVATANTAGGTTASANITPLTELLVAQVTGTQPATYMASVAASTLSTTITASTVSTAQTAVAATLTAAGVSLTGITNMVTDTLVPATTGSTGNGYAQVLGALNQAITSSGTTLAALTTSVAAAAAGGSTNVTASYVDAVTLPAALQLRPQASNCSALRSGRYRLVKLTPSAGAINVVTATEIMTFDAPTLRATRPDGSSSVWAATGPCSYTSGTDVITVSQAGVIVARAALAPTDTSTSQPGTTRVVFALPEQSLALSELAGTWNMLGWERALSGGFMGVAGTFTLGSNGALSSARCFESGLAVADAACDVDTTNLPLLSLHANGGFALTSTDVTDPWVDRVFAYRGGNGEVLLFIINADGQFSFATRQRARGLPSVGNVSVSWNVSTDVSNLASSAVDATSNTVTAVNAANGTFTRTNSTVGTGVSHSQSLAINNGRNGYNYRASGTAVASNGSTVNIREFYALRLAGTGLTAVFLPNSNSTGPSNARFIISVEQP